MQRWIACPSLDHLHNIYIQLQYWRALEQHTFKFEKPFTIYSDSRKSNYFTLIPKPARRVMNKLNEVMYDAHTDLKIPSKNESVLKHMSLLHLQNLTDWTYKWICNLWYKHYFCSAAIDEIYQKDNDDSMIALKANDMYSVWSVCVSYVMYNTSDDTQWALLFDTMPFIWALLSLCISME